MRLQILFIIIALSFSKAAIGQPNILAAFYSSTNIRDSIVSVGSQELKNDKWESRHSYQITSGMMKGGL